MRLIDADVFKTEYENLITWVSHRAEKARLREFIEDIQSQPTVKAIPIEFIERKLAEHWYVDYDIRELLDDWEKENEIDRCGQTEHHRDI